MLTTAGTAIGPYRVERLLGTGGMGEVYLARDVRLGRFVAVKRLAGDADAGGLLHEARAVAALNHPNIAAVYDVLDTSDGRYIVLEYVEGQNLAARLALGRLAPIEAIDIARQLCAAMTAAHDAGIVHRDLKPSNVAITPHGVVKVLDFGIAQRAPRSDDRTQVETGTDTTLSTKRSLAGTPAYMAPEQLLGQAVDGRTDLYAIGLLLYEMLTGVRPFAFAGGDIIAAAAARIEPLRPPSALEAGVPHSLDRIVTRALQPEPRDRFSSSRELDAALAEARQELTDAATGPFEPPAPARDWRRAWVLLALAVVALLMAGLWRRTEAPVPAGAARPVVVAILPFAAAGEGDARENLLGAYVADGVAATLRPTPGLNVLPGTTMDEFGASPEPARVGQRLGADYVVRGTVVRRAADVKVGIEVLQAGSASVWHGERLSAPADLRGLVRLLATDVRSAIGAGDEAAEPGGILPEVRPDTENQDAYADFEQGRSFLLRADVPGNVDRAIALFESAIARDPSFASAHARLGQACLVVFRRTSDGQWVTRAQAAFVEALRLDPARAEVRLALASLHRTQGRAELAIEELRRAARDAPFDDEPHRRLGAVLIDSGRLDEAVGELRQAIALRPNYFNNHSELGYAYYRAGRFADAATAYRRVTELQPDSALGFHMLGTTYQSAGRLDLALENFERANALRPSASTLSNIGTVRFWRGDVGAALAAYEAALRLAPDDPDVWVNLADVQRRLGRVSAARDSYRRAVPYYEQRVAVNARDAFALAQLALLALRVPETGGGGERLAAALAAGGDDPEVLRTAAVVELMRGDVRGACQAVERAIARGLSLVVVRHDEELRGLAGGCPAYERAANGAPGA